MRLNRGWFFKIIGGSLSIAIILMIICYFNGTPTEKQRRLGFKNLQTPIARTCRTCCHVSGLKVTSTCSKAAGFCCTAAITTSRSHCLKRLTGLQKQGGAIFPVITCFTNHSNYLMLIIYIYIIISIYIYIYLTNHSNAIVTTYWYIMTYLPSCICQKSEWCELHWLRHCWEQHPISLHCGQSNDALSLAMANPWLSILKWSNLGWWGGTTTWEGRVKDRKVGMGWNRRREQGNEESWFTYKKWWISIVFLYVD